jgi:CRISPR-associated protein Csb1
MSQILAQFDSYLNDNNHVALVIRERLQPVEGKYAPIFPPTFAPPESSDAKPSYVIDDAGSGLGRVALVDSVGSQANRLEVIFLEEPYSRLVPQIQINIGERAVNLLEAGHRGADAVVRFSLAGDQFQKAFATYREQANAEPLAKLCPTSIVFGAWDSRGTQAKLPRLISSTVRATDVAQLHRSAQYMSLLEKSDAQKIDNDQKFLSKVGFSDAPAGIAPGGVIVRGEIVRDAVLNLVALRSLASSSPERKLALRRYILGLSLVAFAAPAQLFLRQGCLLTLDPNTPSETSLVLRNGHREPLNLNIDNLTAYATAAAAEFGVGESFSTSFSEEKAKKAKPELKAKG